MPLQFAAQSLVLKHSTPGFVFAGGTQTSGNETVTWKEMTPSFLPDPKAAQ